MCLNRTPSGNRCFFSPAPRHRKRGCLCRLFRSSPRRCRRHCPPPLLRCLRVCSILRPFNSLSSLKISKTRYAVISRPSVSLSPSVTVTPSHVEKSAIQRVTSDRSPPPPPGYLDMMPISSASL